MLGGCLPRGAGEEVRKSFSGAAALLALLYKV